MSEQVDVYGRLCDVKSVRRFKDGHQCGVGQDLGVWFVFDKQPDKQWHMHCGPYSTSEQAEDWIKAIREVSR